MRDVIRACRMQAQCYLTVRHKCDSSGAQTREAWGQPPSALSLLLSRAHPLIVNG